MNARLNRLAVILIGVMLRAVPAAATGDHPNIVIVVVDTLRADRVGVNGNPSGLTPFIDQLAGRGTTFVNAYAPSSWTCPSVASLLTSRYPSQHHVAAFESVLADEETTFAEQLAARGYVGGGFSANLRLSAQNGYGQGFAHWRSFIAQPGASKVRAPVLREAALTWLAGLPDGDASPRLLYLQYMEPHAPYDPPEPYRGRFGRLAGQFDPVIANTTLVGPGFGTRGLSQQQVDGLASLYDGEVATVDAEIRLLFTELERRRILDNAIIIITSDHGEEFAEHGELLHGFTLYQAIVRIPMIMVAPGIAGGGVVSQNVSLVDVAPTLIDLLGLPPVASFEGRSLAPMMRAAAPGWWSWLSRKAGPPPPDGEPDVLSELEPIDPKHDLRLHVRTLLSGTNKLLVPRKGEPMMFDVEKDPGEKAPLNGAELTAPRAALVRALEQKESRLRTRPATMAEPVPLDEATKEKLRALGYHP